MMLSMARVVRSRTSVLFLSPNNTRGFLGGLHIPDTSKPSAVEGRRRRPRRKQQDAVQSETSLAEAEAERQAFPGHVAEFTERCLKAVEPLIDVNPGFAVERSSDGQSITITLGENARVGGGNLGQISLMAEPELQLISAGLPITGQGSYRMPALKEGLPGGRRWVLADTHGHDLEGALVRDLLRTCNGCPAF